MASWIVKVKCEVVKQVICEDCTEEEAWDDPFEHATDEMEIDQIDWETIDVHKNVHEIT